MKVKISERWELEVAAAHGDTLNVSGNAAKATTVTVTVSNPSTGHGMNESPGGTVSVTISSYEWYELVNAIGSRIEKPYVDDGYGR